MGSGQLRIERVERGGVYNSERGAAYLKGVTRAPAGSWGEVRRGASGRRPVRIDQDQCYADELTRAALFCIPYVS